jgi:hypothetical protein
MEHGYEVQTIMSLQSPFSSFGSGPAQGQSVLRVYAFSVEFSLHLFPYDQTLLPNFLSHNAASVMRDVVTLIQIYVTALDWGGGGVGQQITPTVLPSGRRTDTQYTGAWEGLRNSLDGCEKFCPH